MTTTATAASHVILGSLGGALEVAGRVGGSLGAALADAARLAFVSGMDLGMTIAAIVAIVGFLIALATLPGRSPRQLVTSEERHLRG